MQMLHDQVVDHPHLMYYPPTEKVGDMFILLFAEELAKVRRQEHNLERALIFPTLILFDGPKAAQRQ